MTSSAEAFADRVLASALGAIEIYSIHIGTELGLYKRLSDEGAMTAAELAASAGIAERYTREWLEQQATAGILTVDQSQDSARFTLPREHAEVLAEELNGFYLATLARMLATSGEKMSLLLDAYRNDTGLPGKLRAGDEGVASRHEPSLLRQRSGRSDCRNRLCPHAYEQAWRAGS